MTGVQTCALPIFFARLLGEKAFYPLAIELQAVDLGPLFFTPSSGQPRPALSSYARRHRSGAIPTGTSFPHTVSLSAWDCMEHTHLIPRLAPSHRKPPSRQPWRATHPPPQKCHFQYKILSFDDIHNTPFCHNPPWQTIYDTIQ